MLRIQQFSNFEVLITPIQILGIYDKNQPKTNLNHVAHNSKLSAVYSAEIYRTAELNQYELHINTRGLIGVLENENVRY